MDGEVLEHLKSYSWPGNVRELANVVQQMMVLGKTGDRITLQDMPAHLLLNEEGLSEEKSGNIQLTKLVSDLERKWIIMKLNETGWNKERTASLLGITRKMLTDRMIKHHVKAPGKKILHS